MVVKTKMVRKMVRVVARIKPINKTSKMVMVEESRTTSETTVVTKDVKTGVNVVRATEMGNLMVKVRDEICK